MSTRSTGSPTLAASVHDLEIRPVTPADQVALSLGVHESNPAVHRYERFGVDVARTDHTTITMLRERAT